MSIVFLKKIRVSLFFFGKPLFFLVFVVIMYLLWR
nr:MAG TPA: hypothetical protein [Caudoviricetes sp.]